MCRFLSVVQLLSSLKRLNGKGLIHADLKPHNVFVEHPINPATGKGTNPSKAYFDVVLGDLGSVVEISSDAMTPKGQTVAYACPSHVLWKKSGWRPKPPGTRENMDVWSLGLVLASMYVGDRVFATMFAGVRYQWQLVEVLKRHHQQQTVTDIVRKKLRWVDPRWVAVIVMCLDYDAETRATPTELLLRDHDQPGLQG